MHKYWARKPHNVVAEYIKHYSKKGDIVLDPFVGSGVTAIEAIKLGRKTVAVDLDPMGIFITRETCKPIDLKSFEKAFKDIESKVKENIYASYKTTCTKCKNEVIAEAIIWEDKSPKQIRYSCHCSKGTQWRNVTQSDLRNLKDIEKKSIPFWYPKNELIWNSRVNVKKGEKVYELFTKRNLLALSLILNEIEQLKNKEIRDTLKFTFSSTLPQASKLVFVIRKRGRQKGEYNETQEVGSWATRGYWIPNEYFEINAWNCFAERFNKVLRGKEESNISIKDYEEADQFNDLNNGANILVKTFNTLQLDNIIPPNSVDYVFTDPPYGDAVPYLELNYMWSSWLKFKPNFDDEIIISNSPVRKKTEDVYERMLKAAFSQVFKVLRPDKYMTVTFHNTDIKVWNAIISACVYAGFDLEKIIYQSPARTSPKGLLAPYASAVGDYYIRFRKPLSIKSMDIEQVDEERYRRIVLESAKKIIAERGEPTPYTFILNGIIIELKKEGALLSGTKNPDDVMKSYLGKEFVHKDVKDKEGKTVGQKWWFKDETVIKHLNQIPLADRLETAVVDVLHRKVKVSFDDILQEIFREFPNSLTPETQSIRDILPEYADKTKDGNWMLKPIMQSRVSAHSWIIVLLAELGRKAGYKILIGHNEQGSIYNGKKLSEYCSDEHPSFKEIPSQNLDRIKQIDIIWYKNGIIHFEFEVENTTAITEAVVRGSNIPYSSVKRFILIPEERERMLFRKIQEPMLKDNIEKNEWKFIFYKDLESLHVESKKKKVIDVTCIEEISKDLKKEKPRQLKLLNV